MATEYRVLLAVGQRPDELTGQLNQLSAEGYEYVDSVNGGKWVVLARTADGDGDGTDKAAGSQRPAAARRRQGA